MSPRNIQQHNNMSSAWLAFCNQHRLAVNEMLGQQLPQQHSQAGLDDFFQAMKYASAQGGKRIRPLTVLASSHELGANVTQALPAACALEMVHAYSLVHDDLPALDNDDFRRGKPSVHRAFGESTAILVGDALLTRAFELISTQPQSPALIAILAKAAGTKGMIGGQVLDLHFEGKQPTPEEILDMYAKKTGALIGAACAMGAVIAEAERKLTDRLYAFGVLVGKVFQVADDVLGSRGDPEKTGKPSGRDQARGKSTLLAYWGEEKTLKFSNSLLEESLDLLHALPIKGVLLQSMAHFALHRTH